MGFLVNFTNFILNSSDTISLCLLHYFLIVLVLEFLTCFPVPLARVLLKDCIINVIVLKKKYYTKHELVISTLVGDVRSQENLNISQDVGHRVDVF